jgi:hypothetical protein
VQIDRNWPKTMVSVQGMKAMSGRQAYTCTLVILARLLLTLRAHMAQQA